MEEVNQPIQIHHAEVVEARHAALPRYERMIVIAEYPQKNVMFKDVNAQQRGQAARRWIAETTGIHLTKTK